MTGVRHTRRQPIGSFCDDEVGRALLNVLGSSWPWLATHRRTEDNSPWFRTCTCPNLLLAKPGTRSDELAARAHRAARHRRVLLPASLHRHWRYTRAASHSASVHRVRCMHKYLCEYICMYMCVHTHTNARTHARTQRHTHIMPSRPGAPLHPCLHVKCGPGPPSVSSLRGPCVCGGGGGLPGKARALHIHIHVRSTSSASCRLETLATQKVVP